MNQSNPPPLPTNTSTLLLAGRWQRLAASLIDGLIIAAIQLPIQIATGFWRLMMDAAMAHEQLPFSALFPWVLVGLALFVIVQGYPLVKDGQTWGKKLLSIRIVDLRGHLPSIPQLSIRYAVYGLLGSIPIIGPIASLINICLVFRSDKRCGHDLAAGTRVVEAARQLQA
jgi:uncharacterized RDD family membrane protein YckC